MSGWIKCSERLPEQLGMSQLVFGLLEGDFNPDVHEAFMSSAASGGRWTSVRSISDGFDNIRWMKIKVTHWQPLPKAPNE